MLTFHSFDDYLGVKDIMKPSTYVLPISVLIITALAMPQNNSVTAASLTEFYPICYPVSDRYPAITFEECEPAMDDLLKHPDYWVPQSWKEFTFPKILASTKTCRFYLTAPKVSDDPFSWSDVNVKAFHILADCSRGSRPPGPGRGGNVNIGEKGDFKLHVRGVIPGESLEDYLEDAQSQEDVEPSHQASTS